MTSFIEMSNQKIQFLILEAALESLTLESQEFSNQMTVVMQVELQAVHPEAFASPFDWLFQQKVTWLASLCSKTAVLLTKLPVWCGVSLGKLTILWSLKLVMSITCSGVFIFNFNFMLCT